VNLDDLAAVGLYRPDAPDAQEQRVLLLRAVEAGAELDDIRQAVAEGWLHALPLRMMLLGTESRMTFGEAADAAGVDREFADRIWSALTLPRRGGRECSADDTAIFSLWAQVRDVLGEEVALRGARTHGVAMAMLADAEVTDVRSILEAPLRAAGDDNVDVSDMLSATIDAVLGPLQAMLARIHLHHLMAAARRYTLWGIAPSVDSTGELVVGFADMVGFTALGNQLEASQTDAVLRAFEARAAHTTTGDTTRLVKLIGDEAMFVAGSVDDALAVARALMTDPELPPLRIGLASGTVVVRGGDVFGSTVNLAARLVAIALPGEILVDATTAERLSDPSIAATGGPRDLPGFPDPVEVCSVRVPISPAGA
jgi:adenylate cyclase